MRRFVSLIAAALFVGGMIAGCGNGGDVELTPAQEQQLEELQREGPPAPPDEQQPPQ